MIDLGQILYVNELAALASKGKIAHVDKKDYALMRALIQEDKENGYVVTVDECTDISFLTDEVGEA